MNISSNAEKLFALLFTKEFDSQKLIAQLNTGCFSPEDISLAALQYINECNGSIDDDEYENFALGEFIPNTESSHLLEALKILLAYGLEPNYAADNCLYNSIISNLRFIHNGYLSADALVLMFEHGGDPNLVVDGDHLFSDVDLDVCWFLGGDIESRYIADTFMHYWMVLVGYGARWEDGSEVIKTFDGFQSSQFCNHRRYYYGIVHGENPNQSWVSFFDKETNREVARH